MQFTPAYEIPDYESAILARQEQQELAEDADDVQDDCARCELLPKCREAAMKHTEYPKCPNRRWRDE